MKAIEKALLTRRNDTKEEIISDYCPNDIPFRILNSPIYCKCDFDEELCTKCWNREIDEDAEEEKVESNESELTFDKLKESPINEMYFSDMTENNFIKSLKNDEYIINCEDGTLTYDDIPKTIKWLQDVYNYCIELKNDDSYVDWITAREHMSKGNKAKLKDCTYWVEGEELYFDLYSEPKTTSLSLPMIDSNEWILL